MAKENSDQINISNGKKASIFSLLGPYLGAVILLSLFSVGSSGLGLVLPKIISHAIDSFIRGDFVQRTFILEFGGLILLIFVLTYLQSIMQTFTSERVAKDLRNSLAKKISEQSYEFVERVGPSKLLTNLTSDIDSIKMFVGQATASLISSVVIVIGATIFLLSINWRLGLAVLCIVPIIALLFFFIFRQVKVLMKKSREVIDWLNKVINESVLGAALIRVLNSQDRESIKFAEANSEARQVGLKILNMFAALIPLITFVANMATLVILIIGGHFVISGSMSLGDFAAFNSYVALLIFPLLVMGIMGSIISQSQASYSRIQEVLEAEDSIKDGDIEKDLEGHIEFKGVNMKYGQKFALRDVSFDIKPHTKTAIIGPTAAGKTQILQLLIRLLPPTEGEIYIDDNPLKSYKASSLHKQIGFVFQDSVIFNLTLRENIAFGGVADEQSINKAIETAELGDFVSSLPGGLNTVISERGTSLSGGQKQRIMLARALALNPRILLLDDFTARVDTKTEKKILDNVARNYPDITLVSVTQKISSVEKYDRIILIMEGEVVSQGTHEELLSSSPEYNQIYDSQKSTSQYE